MLVAGHRVNTRIQRWRHNLPLFFFTPARAFVLLSPQAACLRYIKAHFHVVAFFRKRHNQQREVAYLHRGEIDDTNFQVRVKTDQFYSGAGT